LYKKFKQLAHIRLLVKDAIRSESDDNFDGAYETKYKYKQGVVQLHESNIK